MPRRGTGRWAAAVLVLAGAAACASAAAVPTRAAVPLTRLVGETVMSPLTGPPDAAFLRACAPASSAG